MIASKNKKWITPLIKLVINRRWLAWRSGNMPLFCHYRDRSIKACAFSSTWKLSDTCPISKCENPTIDKLRPVAHQPKLDEAMSIEERLDHFESFLATKPSSESVVAYYDKFGKDYEAAIEKACGDEDSFFFPEIRSRFPDINLRILDVCAGTGMLGKDLHEHGYSNVDALDGNATLLEIARAKCVYVNLYRELIGTEALKSVELESYDLVLCAGSFYELHLEGRHLKAILSACKKGGFFAFTSYPVDDENYTKVTSTVREMEKDGLIRIEENKIIPHKYWKDENQQKLFILQKL